MDYNKLVKDFFKVPSYEKMIVTTVATFTVAMAIEVGVFTYASYKFKKAGDEFFQTVDEVFKDSNIKQKQYPLQSIDDSVQ